MPLHRASIVVPIACLAILSGCGGSGNTVRVTGKLLKGGTRFTPPDGHAIGVTFYAIEIQDPSGKSVRSSEPFDADVDDEAGTFRVPGPEGRGIPPGKYRVAVTQRMLREAFEAAKRRAAPGKKPITRETDFLDDRFGPTTSPIVREIHEATELVVDLDRPTGS